MPDLKTVSRRIPGFQPDPDSIAGVQQPADHPDAVTDEMWARAAEHFDDSALAALVSMAALTNYFNRVDTALRIQPSAHGR